MSPALPNNWYYVYLLASEKSSWIYVGCTNNLERRLKEHNSKGSFSTKTKLPVELIYYEAFRSRDRAYNREKNLKSYGSALGKLKCRLGIDGKGRAG